jgi:EmrB/QacA subfamily drug resistance transporter
VVVLGTIMSILDTTVVNVALARLVTDFHTKISTIQWVSSGYLIALAVVIPLTPWAIDRIGARRAWMISVGLFVLSSAACGFAWSPTSLIGFRIMQGIGGGMIMPIGQTILTREAGVSRLPRVMGVLMIPTLFAPMLGPVVGGVILSQLSWRWIFFVNVPIGATALCLAWRGLPRGEEIQKRRLDIVGLLTLSPGLALLIYGLSEIGSAGGFSTRVVLTFVAGTLLMVTFVVHSRRVDHPLLDIRLWRDRAFSSTNATSFFTSATINAGMVLIPLYYQQVQGSSPVRAALLMMPGAIGAMITSQLSSRLTRRLGVRRLATIGIAIMVVSMITYIQVGVATSTWLLGTAWFVRGVGNGGLIPALQSAGYTTLDRSQYAAASTLNNIGMRIGGAVGVAVGAVVLQLSIGAGSPRTTALPLHSLAHAYGLAFGSTVVMAALAFLPSRGLPKRVRIDGPQPTAVRIEAEIAPVE